MGAPMIHALDLSDARRRCPTALRVRRLAQITRVTTRQLGPALLRWSRHRDTDLREAIGRPLRDMVLELGVTFVKLGQLLASSPSVSGAALADAMRGVLDAGPAVPFAQLRAIIETDLGRPLESVFAEFSPTPVAAASLAVVHRATLLDGTDVAVKVLRPNSAGEVATDLTIVQPFVRFLAHQYPFGFTPAVPDIIDGLAEQLAEELDLRNEARSMAWFDKMFKLVGAKGVRVPVTYPEASGRSVLTMEFIHGTKVDDLEALAENNIDARSAIEALIESWFALTLCTGVFHGDVHAGNLLLTDDGEARLARLGHRRSAAREVAPILPSLSRRRARRRDGVGRRARPRDGSVRARRDAAARHVGSRHHQDDSRPDDDDHDATLQRAEPDGPHADDAGGGRRRRPPSSGGQVGSFLQRRRRAAVADVAAMQTQQQERGELLMMKQLVYFERYGKMFLGDEPLIYDPEMYKALLALPSLAEAT